MRKHCVVHGILFSVFLLVLIPGTLAKTVEKPAAKPVWITKISPDTGYLFDKNTSYGSYYYLLVDFQDNIRKQEMFRHFAIKIFNNEGVQSLSDISVDFDPAYQKLFFHEVNIYRNGTKIGILKNHEIKTVQREQEMERFLYDGRLTAYMNLTDMREGDILEYSFTIQGFNPAYRGYYSSLIYFEYNDPVVSIFRKIVVPQEISLNCFPQYGMGTPDITKKGNDNEYSWQARDVKAYYSDSNTPVWFDGSKRTVASTYSSWNDVVNVFIKGYNFDRRTIAASHKAFREAMGKFNPDSALKSCIRFVQDGIRYLAVESGENAYNPLSPLATMENRYGDCKAKSSLLVTLLREEGFEAYPVLVSSSGIKNDTTVFPSHNYFNHVIVKIINNGNTTFVDPTFNNQGGDPDSLWIPDYGYGLVLRQGTESLEKITCNVKSLSEITTRAIIDSIGGTVHLKVSTVNRGYYADDSRSSFKSSSSEEITRNFLRFYSNHYPHIKELAPIKFSDDRENNIFTVEEEYLIDSAWTESAENKKMIEFIIGGFVINGAFVSPQSPARTMPYAIPHPLNIRERILIDLPEEWTVVPKMTTIADSVFLFTYSSFYAGNTITLNYRLQTYEDCIPATSYNSYYSNYETVNKSLLYKISYHTSITEKSNTSTGALLIFILLTAGFSSIAVLIYRRCNWRHRGTVHSEFGNKKEREIGGWLVLVAIGLFISSVRIPIEFVLTGDFFKESTWSVLSSNSSSWGPLLLIVAFIEFLYNSAAIVYLVLLQFLFFNRRSCLPRLIIIFYIANALFVSLDTVAVLSVEELNTDDGNVEALTQMIQAIAVAAVWGSYFYFSERVKETFTRSAPGAKRNNEHNYSVGVIDSLQEKQ